MPSSVWSSVQQTLNFYTAMKKCIPEKKVVSESKVNVNVTKERGKFFFIFLISTTA